METASKEYIDCIYFYRLPSGNIWELELTTTIQNFNKIFLQENLIGAKFPDSYSSESKKPIFYIRKDFYPLGLDTEKNLIREIKKSQTIYYESI